MGKDPTMTSRRLREGRAERSAAQQRWAPTQQPLPDQTAEVRYTPTTPQGSSSEPLSHLDALLHDLLVDRPDGVLKFCPTDNWALCYVYWRWSRGQWAGHYVCAAGSAYELVPLLRILSGKITEVEMGSRKPTKDRYS